MYIEHLRVLTLIPQGKKYIFVVQGFFAFFFFCYGMSIESLDVVKGQPDNNPNATAKIH